VICGRAAITAGGGTAIAASVAARSAADGGNVVLINSWRRENPEQNRNDRVNGIDYSCMFVHVSANSCRI
jgi:hypothetical protein